MNYYDINIIKNKLMQQLEERENRKLLSHISGLEYLFNHFEFKEIYIQSNKKLSKVFSDDQLDKIKLCWYMKNKNFKITDDFLKAARTGEADIVAYPVNTIEDLKLALLTARETPAFKAYKAQKELDKVEMLERTKTYGEVKNFDLSNTYAVAIDFEYYSGVIDKFNIKHIREAGLTFFKDGKMESYHYIVQEHIDKISENKTKLQQSFNFGISQTVTSDELKNCIEIALLKTAAIIVHEHSTELAFLERNKIDYSQHKVFDTQIVHRHHLKKEGEHDSLKLKTLLENHMIIAKNLHNAGNDAYYTAKLFNVMVKDVQRNERKKLYGYKI